MSKYISLAARIDELLHQFGSLRAAAKATRIDTAYLSRLQSGIKTNPSEDTLQKLGLRRVVMYEVVDSKEISKDEIK
jgi:hypothetical protein